MLDLQPRLTGYQSSGFGDSDLKGPVGDTMNYPRKLTKRIAVAVALAAPTARSQMLVQESALSAPDADAVVIMPVRCDSRGNIFLRPPLSKIAADGKRVATFDLSAAANDGLKNLLFKAFALGPDGRVYELARADDQHVVIVAFDTDGRYSATLRLDEQFEPQQLAVFTGDVFLVSGVVLVKGGPHPELAPYTAIFDRSGRMLRKIDLTEVPAAPEIGPPGPAMQSDAPVPLGPPELGGAESDGAYAYLLRQGTLPTVLVLSAAGAIDRVLKLAPPYPNTIVSGFRVGSGRLLVEYSRPNALPNGNTAYDLVIYDAHTGEVLSKYARDPALGGVLACTDWRGRFTLLSTDSSGKRVLVTAATR